MDVTYSAEAEQYREKIQAFLSEHLPNGWKGLGGLAEEQRPAHIVPGRPEQLLDI